MLGSRPDMIPVDGKSVSIFGYSDYRTFLGDFYRARKRSKSGWSYAVWAKQLKLRSASSLLMVIKGQCNPSPELTRNLSEYFAMGPREADYFHDLVQLKKKQADARLSVLIMERLAKRQRAGAVQYLDMDRFAAVSTWYFYAIREMVRMPGFVEDPIWISRRLRYKVTRKQVSDAIATLLKVGLLKRTDEGALAVAESDVETSHDVAHEAIRRFHEQTLENAKTSLRTVDIRNREIVGTTFALRRASLPQAKARLRELLSQFCDQFEDPEGESLFQLEMALFPLTRSPEAL